MERILSAIGLITMLILAWLLSNNKRKMNWRVIIGGTFLQVILAFIILKTDVGSLIFSYANSFFTAITALSDEGAKFIFGENFAEHFFAFKVLPTIIFVSSVSYVLFYLGIMQKIVELLAISIHKVMGISGVESLVATANIFLGQTEAPLLVKPYIKTMTNTEILVMMTSGMATVAGGVMAAYIGMGISAGHLLAASFMSAPASIVVARIMFPETEHSVTQGKIKVKLESPAVNILDAACRGAADGLHLALNVAAMLIAFIALVALFNYFLALIFNPIGITVTLQSILAWLFQPLAFIMGVPWDDCLRIGQIIGEKIIVNEFVAYHHLSENIKTAVLQERSVLIATYALCGFANFSSIAIQIGGIGNLEPARKTDFAVLGLRSMIGGNLACFMTACIAGMIF